MTYRVMMGSDKMVVCEPVYAEVQNPLTGCTRWTKFLEMNGPSSWTLGVCGDQVVAPQPSFFVPALALLKKKKSPSQCCPLSPADVHLEITSFSEAIKGKYWNIKIIVVHINSNNAHNHDQTKGLFSQTKPNREMSLKWQVTQRNCSEHRSVPTTRSGAGTRNCLNAAVL